MIQQWNKAYLGAAGPLLLQLFLKIDAKVLVPIDWSMGEAFWTGVTGVIIGVLVAKVPNKRDPNAAERASDSQVGA